MAVSVGDFVRLTAKMKLFGTEDVMNTYTYHIDRNDSLDDDDFMDQAALFMDDVYTIINDDISDLLSYVTVDGFNISKTELMPEKPWPVLTDGGNEGNLLPTQIAAEVFWPTTTPKVRTSVYLGGYGASLNTAEGAISAVALARLATLGAALKVMDMADIEGHKGSFNPTKVIFTDAGDPVVPERWRTQRRRRVGVGS